MNARLVTTPTASTPDRRITSTRSGISFGSVIAFPSFLSVKLSRKLHGVPGGAPERDFVIPLSPVVMRGAFENRTAGVIA